MMSATSETPRPRKAGILRRLATCRRGVAAIEFGYIAPIMLIMFLGALEFSRAVTIDRRTTQVASSTADLVARQTTVSLTDLNGYMQIIAHLLSPYNSDDLRLTVASVYIPAGGTAADTKICWSYNRSVTIAGTPTSRGVNTYTNNQAFTGLPAGLIAAGESLIMVQVEYDYVPYVQNVLGFSNGLMQGIKTMRETFYLKPRLSSSVEHAGNSCV